MNIALLLIIVALLALFIGYPVGLTLGGVAILFAVLGSFFGIFEIGLLQAIGPRLFGILTNQLLLSIPFFIFMGLVLQKSGIAKNMFEFLAYILRGKRGGLSISVIIIGAILAACTGIVGASIATLGLMAIPTMLQEKIAKQKIAGTIIATGTLGQLIPPSIVLIVLTDQIANAYQLMQNKQGIFGGEPLLLSDMFLATIVPSLMLVICYIFWQYITGNKTKTKKVEVNFFILCENFLLPFMLIVTVLFILLGNFATPIEAAMLGCIFAILLAIKQFSKRLFVSGLAAIIVFFIPIAIMQYITSIFFAVIIVFSLYILWQKNILAEIIGETVQLVGIIFLIIFATSIFALVFRGFGGDIMVENFLINLPGETFGALLFVMLFIFLLGFFLEFLEITYLIIPITAPILLAMPMADGSLMNPLWLGVLLAINLQTSFLTPPMGISLFYFKATAESITKKFKIVDIYKGVVPYIIMQLVILLCVYFYPNLAIWLPTAI